LILACNGIHAEVTTTFPQLSAGDTCTLASYCVLRSSQSPIILDSITAFGNTIYKKSNGDTLNPFKGFRNNCKYTVPNNMVIREPYWLRKGIENQLFVNDGAQLNLCLPEINTAYEATLFLKIEGITLPITVPINYRLIDDKKGEVQQPLQIIPSIEIRADKTVLPFDTKNTRFLMKEKSSLEDKIISQKIDAKAREVQLSFTKNNIEYTKQMNSIQYDHIPTQTWYSHATINILEEPILYTAKRVGYIAGTGDKIIDAIKLIGYSVDILLQKDIDSATLKLYDAILVGIRAYSELPWLQQKHAVFMQYISNGGTLIANYNSISDGEKLNIGPYPFAIGRKRVTEQNANVTMLPNASNVFIKPNKIVENDWKNWIQERSVYHVENFDSVNYTPLLSMHDKGEPDDNSAVFYCKYGKGFFVYNSLALFRQLPAGHTGAHKLLANLIEISEQ
jgi:hypothetical protein